MGDIDIKEAEKKIIFADYLIHREDNETYLPAAVKHIITAANIAVRYLTNIDENRASSPQLVQQALIKFEEKRAVDFSKFYLGMWKSPDHPPSPADVANSLKTVKDFISWVKGQKNETNS